MHDFFKNLLTFKLRVVFSFCSTLPKHAFFAKDTPKNEIHFIHRSKVKQRRLQVNFLRQSTLPIEWQGMGIYFMFVISINRSSKLVLSELSVHID